MPISLNALLIEPEGHKLRGPQARGRLWPESSINRAFNEIGMV